MPVYQYPCLVTHQRPDQADAPQFCAFFAPAGQVLEWAAIERIVEKQAGFQRIANPAKVKGIKRFFEQDPRNTIPTAVVLTLNHPGITIRTEDCAGGSRSTLEFEVAADLAPADKPGIVIDGQHRLLGTNDFDPKILVPVIALLNPSQLEAAFQFLVINNKSAKVPTDHIRRLALNYNEQNLEQRLKTARLSLNRNYEYVGQVDSEEGSPFRGIIKWPTHPPRDGFVVPAAIEGAMQYILDQQLQPLKEDDPLLEYFYAVWNAVKSAWPDLWNPESKLLSKVGVVCMTRYLTDSLAKMYEWGKADLTDPEQIGTCTTELLGQQAKAFWTVAWREGGYDTSIGRQLVVDDLTRIARNTRARLPWFEELAVIKREELIPS